MLKKSDVVQLTHTQNCKDASEGTQRHGGAPQTQRVGRQKNVLHTLQPLSFQEDVATEGPRYYQNTCCENSGEATAATRHKKRQQLAVHIAVHGVWYMHNTLHNSTKMLSTDGVQHSSKGGYCHFLPSAHLRNTQCSHTNFSCSLIRSSLLGFVFLGVHAHTMLNCIISAVLVPHCTPCSEQVPTRGKKNTLLPNMPLPSLYLGPSQPLCATSA